MGKIVLIGGGEIGRGNTTYQTKEIDEEIVNMTSKDNPIFLFIGLASSFSDSYYNTIKKIYQNLGCTTYYLKKKNLVNNFELAKEKINLADIIYIGGGDTIKLLEELEEFQLKPLLEKALKENRVLVGYSAGAIALAKKGFSDSKILRGESNNYEFIEGLNLIEIEICPHYHKDPKKTAELQKQIKEHNLKIYALEDETALKINNSKKSALKSNINKNVYICYYNKNNKEEIIKNE